MKLLENVFFKGYPMYGMFACFSKIFSVAKW